MSEDSDSKLYHYPSLERPEGASACRGSAPCGSMAQLHRMGGFGAARPDLGLPSEGSDSSGADPPGAAARQGARSLRRAEDDVEMKSGGSTSGSGTESHGNDSRGNDSHGNESTASSNGNSKDSALLESSGSNKSSNSHSLSPAGSSNAFSLLSGSSEQNPSTSGCSSEESAKAKTQKELLKTLKELKRLLPVEKRNKGKSSTLSTLKYALNCVRQVEANEEYYQMLMINDSQPSGLDVSSYTIEEIDRITSEYTLKNNDMFAVAVSLATGKVVYISDQAAAILNCKRGVFKDAKFVEFLTPQDVSLFYSFTTPYRLPTWGMCTGAESSAPDCVQEKSFFCRLRASGGKECEGDLQCYPFRMTPYLMKVQDRAHEEDQFCCLLLAERVHSGYEAPRIPTDKRIFTTTHTPNCVFQDVDERAVPLLGYLPQDLIGTQVLLHLHPKDRPIMLSIHKKILQYAGQPFDHSSVRFRARNGEYVVVDTSWSSFVNPWSRKVSFVIGRHKVRMGPVNEDVFVAPAEVKGVESDVQEITEQIHRLLLQTVHNNGSSGYGSLGSNDHLQGVTSSGESVANDNGSRTLTAEEEAETSKTKPRTFQEICKGIQRQKSQEQQLCLGSSAKPDAKKNTGKSQHKTPAAVRPKDSAAAAPPSSKETGGVAQGGVAQWEGTRTPVPEELAFNDQTVYSYQQISCLDSVIRYLESCNVPITMKRKCHSSGNTTSSDEDKPSGAVPMQVSEEQARLKAQPGHSPLDDAANKPTGTPAPAAVVGTSLAPPLALPSKAESVLSITSQCSYSSTIVHVGDKKPHPESEIIEDVSGAGETGDAGQPTGGPHSSAVSPPCQEREPYRKLGLLTKQVLAAHTEKEEQAFLYRFREVRGVKAFKADCSRYLERQRGPMASDAVPGDAHACRNGAAARRPGRGRKCRSKRARQTESSDSAESREWEELQQQQQQQRRRCQPASPAPLRAPVVPGAYPPMQVYHPGAGAVPPHPDPSLHGFVDHQDPRGATPYPMVAPMVALVLPNYMLPQQPHQPFYQLDATGCFPAQPTPYATPYATPTPYPGPAYPSPVSFSVHAQFHPQGPFAPQMQGPFAFPAQPFAFVPSPPAGGGAPKPVVGEGLSSRPGTPQSAAGARDQASSPPLFQSRCSSPLQLNLLQLEESQRSLERQDSAGPQGNGEKGGGGGGAAGHAQEKELQKVGSHGNGNQSDANSSSSDLLDILLQEDSQSGSGSATSGSMGSGLNGCGMSGSGTSNSRTSNSRTSNSRTSNSRTSNSRTSNSRTSNSRTSNSRTSASGASASGTGSNNSSNYFGSVDSSQNSRKVKGHSGRERGCGSSEAPPMEVERSQHFKYVLQDPPWLLKANADEEVMMTYQLPSRDIQRVLMADRERLRAMHSTQPCFTAHQKKELLQVHPWLRRGGLPKAINVKACVCCDDALAVPPASGEHSDLDMGETEMETVELGCPRKPRDELSSNANVNPGPCSLLCDS